MLYMYMYAACTRAVSNNTTTCVIATYSQSAAAVDVEDVSSWIQAAWLPWQICRGLSTLIRSRAGTKGASAVAFKWRHGDQSLEVLSTNQIYGAQLCAQVIFFCQTWIIPLFSWIAGSWGYIYIYKLYKLQADHSWDTPQANFAGALYHI